MKTEIWKDIKEYEGLYQISNTGRIKSLSYRGHGIEKILSNRKAKSIKYYTICLSKNNIQKYFLIHRLVAQTFIDNKENKLQVNHKDGNKFNNNVENLEWATNSENRIHSYRVLGLSSPMKGKYGKLISSSKKIYQYSLDGTFIKEWESRNDVARYFGRRVGNNFKIVINKENRTLYGYKWKSKKII